MVSELQKLTLAFRGISDDDDPDNGDVNSDSEDDEKLPGGDEFEEEELDSGKSEE